MTRMTRHEYLAGRPVRERRTSRREVAALLAKHVKQALIAKNLIPADEKPAPREPRKVYGWSFEGRDGIVRADCRSDARGLIKRELGIGRKDRLPLKVQITELDPSAHQSASA